MKGIIALLVFMVALCGGGLEAAIVFDGGTYDINQYSAGSNTNCGSSCQVVGAQFSLSAEMNVLTDVHWWGAYYPSVFPDDFTINIYAFASGNPSVTPLYTFNIGDTATRTYTGYNYTYNNSPIYEYDVVIPATTLTPGQPYLLSIVHNTPAGVEQSWGWTLGGSTGIAWTYTQNQGWHVTAPTPETHQYVAFNLTGTSSAPAAVPTMTEWGMIIFMGLAGLGSVYYLRRQKREER